MTTSQRDAESLECVLADEGFATLPGALLATALATYASSAAMAEADALSPLVVGFGQTFDGASSAAVDVIDELDAAVLGNGAAFDAVIDSDTSSILHGLAAIEIDAVDAGSTDVLASMGVNLDLGFGTGVSGLPSTGDAAVVAPAADAMTAEAADAASSDATLDAVAGDLIDASAIDITAVDTTVLDDSLSITADTSIGIEVWDASSGVMLSDPAGDDPADLGLDDAIG